MTAFTGNTLHRIRVAVAVLCLAQFVVVLDVTIVATALPAIGRGLGFSASLLGWVLTGYTVVLAGLLVAGGRVADVAGAVLAFRIGLTIFTVASLGCALAWSPMALIGARIVQGVGAALLSPAALAALTSAVQDTPAARRALGWWTAAAAGGGASGWVLGGLLVQSVGWRWVFGINAPIGLAALIVARVVLEPVEGTGSTRQGHRRPLDLTGAAWLIAAITLMTLGLARLAEQPRGALGWAALASAVVTSVIFVRHERVVGDPLLPADMFRTSGVLGGNLTAFALTAATTPAMLTVLLYLHNLIDVRVTTSLWLFPIFNVAVIGGSLLGPVLIERAGSRTGLAVGFMAIVGGVCTLFALTADGLSVAVLVVSFVLMGGGLGTASVSSTTLGTVHVSRTDQGVASGLLNSTAQLGSAAGLALVAPIVANAASLTGYRIGFGVAAAVAIFGAMSAVLTARF